MISFICRLFLREESCEMKILLTMSLLYHQRSDNDRFLPVGSGKPSPAPPLCRNRPDGWRCTWSCWSGSLSCLPSAHWPGYGWGRSQWSSPWPPGRAEAPAGSSTSRSRHRDCQLMYTRAHTHNTVLLHYHSIVFCILQCLTYSEEAVEVWEIKSMCDLSQDVQGQLSLIGWFTALIGSAPQGWRMTWMERLHQELNTSKKRTN